MTSVAELPGFPVASTATTTRLLRCTWCTHELPEDDFPRDRFNLARHGRYTVCRACRATRTPSRSRKRPDSRCLQCGGSLAGKPREQRRCRPCLLDLVGLPPEWQPEWLNEPTLAEWTCRRIAEVAP